MFIITDRKMHIKTTVRYQLIQSRTATVKKTPPTHAGTDGEESDPHGRWSCKIVQNSLAVPQNVKQSDRLTQ